jgi:hypothetical protein
MPFENQLEIRILKDKKVLRNQLQTPPQNPSNSPIEAEHSDTSDDENLEKLNKEIEKMKEKLEEQKHLERPSKSPKSLNSQSAGEKDDQCDIYSVEEILQRNLMSVQQRRFGSPEFAVRNNTISQINQALII